MLLPRSPDSLVSEDDRHEFKGLITGVGNCMTPPTARQHCVARLKFPLLSVIHDVGPAAEDE